MTESAKPTLRAPSTALPSDFEAFVAEHAENLKIDEVWGMELRDVLEAPEQ